MVIDADLLAREVVAPGSPGLAAVVDAFGEQVRTPSGELDRPALGTVVFADEGSRRRLEAILHPLIRELSARREAEAPVGALVVHDIPLLVEGDRADTFDTVIVVDVPTGTQVDRMVSERGMSVADAQARIAAQATREQRLAVADYVIDNTGTLEDLRDRVTEVFAALNGG